MSTTPTPTNDRRTIIGPVRLSYTYLAEPQLDDHDELVYQTQILIPKKDKESVAAIKRIIIAAAVKKYGPEKGKKILQNPAFKKPVRDPEAEDREGEEYVGMLFANAKSKASISKPGLILRNGTKITDPDEAHEHFYSGVWAKISLTAYFFDNNGSKGIALAVNNVMKYKDGDKLDGSMSADDEFADEFEEDDVDMGEAGETGEASGGDEDLLDF